MNKKANVYSVIILSLMLFMSGMIVANFLKSPIDDARASLDCSNAAGISDGTKFMCLTVDMAMIYWIILIFSIAGGLIADKLLI